MKKLLMIASLTLASSFAFAQPVPPDHGPQDYKELRLSAGGKGLATEYGLDFEHRMGPMGLDAFASFSKNREKQNLISGQPEQWVLGVAWAFHMPTPPAFNLYIAPGLAAIYQKNVAADDSNVTTFGPALKIGGAYELTPAWNVGVEFVSLTNWFSDKIVAEQTSGHAMVGYRF